MTIPTILAVTYMDAGPTYSTVRYRQLTDLENDGSNLGDIMTETGILITALDVLTGDKIQNWTWEFKRNGSGAAPAVDSNNLSYAFSRCHDESDPTIRTHFSVPAWDDTVFDKTPSNMLSGAYNTAAADVAALLRDIDTGDTIVHDEAAARSTKRGDRLARRI